MINIPNNFSKISPNNPYMQLLNQNPISTNKIETTVQQKIEPKSNIIPNTLNESFEDKCQKMLYDINDNLIKLLEKKQKHKKNTYLKITKTMFDNDILPNYSDFPIEKMDLIYSDGKDYFIEIGNKKYPLNKKHFLKFINYILK